MTPTSIVLPDELRPADGRFGSGPAKVPSSAVERLAKAAPDLLGTSHRRRLVPRRALSLASGQNHHQR
jgi:phosphoserine aminotransferase